MLPSRFTWEQIRTLVGADPTTIGGDDPDAPKLVGIIAPYTDNPNLVVGDLTLATTEFQWVLLAADGSIDDSTDPVTQAAKWQRHDDARANSLKSSNTGLPVTLYGVALVSNDLATLYATQQLENAITFDAEDQEFDVPRMQFNYPRDLVR